MRIVVVDNDGGGIFDFLPQAEQLDADEFEALLGTPRGVDAGEAAALFGLRYTRVDDLAELARSARRRHRPDRGPGRPGRRTSSLHRRLTEAATAALSGS